MAKDAKYTVSADIVGHCQHMSGLPEIGASVHVVWSGVDVVGEVFAHVPHPEPEQAGRGWGFALIRFN